MDPARFRDCIAQRQRDVDGLGGEAGVEGCRFQDIAAGGKRLRYLVLGKVDRRTLGLALIRRHLAERRQQRGDRALLAERSDAYRFERGLVGRRGDIGENGLFEYCKVGHGGGHLWECARQSGKRNRHHPRKRMIQ